MTVATILGAGAMGSAFARPLAASGCDVRLWGTRLDDEFVPALRQREPHPRTGEPLPEAVVVYTSDQIAEALDGVDLIVIAVASVGFEEVLAFATDHLTRAPAGLLILTKGLLAGPTGSVELLNEAAARIQSARGFDVPTVVVGGPCKANEVAAGRPTWAVFAGDDQMLREIAPSFNTPQYQVTTSTDVIGVEIASALKNVFAVGLGLCDGFAGHDVQPWHDLRAATFTQAAWELSTTVELLGGLSSTATGLAGIGDLDVTGRSGRNRSLGELIGRGQAAYEAREAMGELGLTVEGWAVASLVERLANERIGVAGLTGLPLLNALVRILTEANVSGVQGLLTRAVGQGLERPDLQSRPRDVPSPGLATASISGTPRLKEEPARANPHEPS